MIRTQVYLQDQQYHLAKLIAEEENIPFSEIIRHGLDLALEEKQKKRNTKKRSLHSFAGQFPVGPGYEHMARDHNAIYDSGK